MMNYNKLFALAKEKGITALTVSKSSGSSIDVAIFHGEMENYSINSSRGYTIKGIYNNKFGGVSTEVEDINYIVDEIINNAKVNEKKEEPEIFKGSKSYKKRNYFNKELSSYPLDEKIANLYKIEKAIKEYDSRVSDVEVSYSESSSDYEIRNSYGLKLKTNTNHYVYSAEVIVKDGEETKTGYKLFFSNDVKDFNLDKFVKEAVEDATSKLNGVSIKSKKYKVILANKAVSSFVGAYMGWVSSEEVQKQSSRFIGKLNQQVASKKLTIEEKPLWNNIFGRGFDDEGVATSNKKIIDKGVLKTYLYNLETAKKDGVETTGNGYGALKIGIDTTNIVLKPGKLTEDELIAKVGNGVYIASVTGLHSGMNAQSGNFSLQAEGYVIENGKKTSPLKMITVAGNMYDLFNDIQVVGGNNETQLSGVTCPSIIIKKLAVTSAK